MQWVAGGSNNSSSISFVIRLMTQGGSKIAE
jgi:hypothetical protein